jgi:hypothetical protein
MGMESFSFEAANDNEFPPEREVMQYIFSRLEGTNYKITEQMYDSAGRLIPRVC